MWSPVESTNFFTYEYKQDLPKGNYTVSFYRDELVQTKSIVALEAYNSSTSITKIFKTVPENVDLVMLRDGYVSFLLKLHTNDLCLPRPRIYHVVVCLDDNQNKTSTRLLTRSKQLLEPTSDLSRSVSLKTISELLQRICRFLFELIDVTTPNIFEDHVQKITKHKILGLELKKSNEQICELLLHKIAADLLPSAEIVDAIVSPRIQTLLKHIVQSRIECMTVLQRKESSVNIHACYEYFQTVFGKLLGEARHVEISSFCALTKLSETPSF